jgi:hypothetical protein
VPQGDPSTVVHSYPVMLGVLRGEVNQWMWRGKTQVDEYEELRRLCGIGGGPGRR